MTALGASFEPVRSYTDHNCTRCGSCLQGCPTNAGKSVLNTVIAPALGRDEIRLRTRTTAERVLISDGSVTGVACDTGVERARTVVLARTLERGYGINREESEVGVSAVAAPVFDHRRRVIAAISITGHSGRLDLERLAPAVRTAGLSLSREPSHAAASGTLILPPAEDGRATSVEHDLR